MRFLIALFIIIFVGHGLTYSQNENVENTVIGYTYNLHKIKAHRFGGDETIKLSGRVFLDPRTKYSPKHKSEEHWYFYRYEFKHHDIFEIPGKKAISKIVKHDKTKDYFVALKFINQWRQHSYTDIMDNVNVSAGHEVGCEECNFKNEIYDITGNWMFTVYYEIKPIYKDENLKTVEEVVYNNESRAKSTSTAGVELSSPSSKNIDSNTDRSSDKSLASNTENNVVANSSNKNISDSKNSSSLNENKDQVISKENNTPTQSSTESEKKELHKTVVAIHEKNEEGGKRSNSKEVEIETNKFEIDKKTDLVDQAPRQEDVKSSADLSVTKDLIGKESQKDLEIHSQKEVDKGSQTNRSGPKDTDVAAKKSIVTTKELKENEITEANEIENFDQLSVKEKIQAKKELKRKKEFKDKIARQKFAEKFKNRNTEKALVENIKVEDSDASVKKNPKFENEVIKETNTGSVTSVEIQDREEKRIENLVQPDHFIDLEGRVIKTPIQAIFKEEEFTYHVLFRVLGRPDEPFTDLQHIGPLYRETFDRKGSTRYLLGNSKSIEGAQKVVDKINESGIYSSYIAEYKNGKLQRYIDN